jgi:hydroxyethylthiazole kinase-like uncharacterized protein yjeF
MIELLTPEEMAEADRRTIAAGQAGFVLMQRAGQAVADFVAARLPRGARVGVLCGLGNNGGDGFVAARILRQRGYAVRLSLLGSRGHLKGDAARAAREWSGQIEPAATVVGDADLLVDALFGAGLARDLDGDAKASVDCINGSGRPVVAVDLPSGIDGANGAIRGAAVRADVTITFCRKKPGHLLLPGRLHCGEIKVVDIGIGDATVSSLARTFVNEPALWRAQFPVPRIDGHKYDRGHAVVVSGPMHATGAARLAAGAALRAGAGLVTVAAPKEALPVLAASLTAVMVRQADGAKGLARLLDDERLNAVLLGPGQGIGKQTRDAVMAAARAKRRLVLDADALTSLADAPEALAGVLADAESAVLTPHEGEFARLIGSNETVIGAKGKLARAKAAATAMNAVMLLKGADTVVASPDGRAAIAENSPPWLATAGTGDVLAGITVGLLAQGMPAFDAAAAAVWLHGEAGRAAGAAMISEDLDAALRSVLQRLIADRPAA